MTSRIKAPPAPAAGLSGGTGFAGIVMLLPESSIKSVLLILAPAITIAISSTWHLIADEINEYIANFRIGRNIRAAERRWNTIKDDPSISDHTKAKAKENLETLLTVEIDIAKQRITALTPS